MKSLRISPYWKTVIASLAPVGYTIQAAVTDGQITGSEGIGIGIALLVALGVYAVPNQPSEKPQATELPKL